MTIWQVLMILVVKMGLTAQSGAIMTHPVYQWVYCDTVNSTPGNWGRTSKFDLTKDTPALSLWANLELMEGSIESILVEIDLVIMVPHGKWLRAYWYRSSPILVLSCIIISINNLCRAWYSTTMELCVVWEFPSPPIGDSNCRDCHHRKALHCRSTSHG